MDDGDRRGSSWRAVAGLALMVTLVLAALLVVRQLRHAAVIQDCVASGRHDCVPMGPQ